MRNSRYQIEPIVEGSSYILGIPLRSHAQHRARGCISMSGSSDVNTQLARNSGLTDNSVWNSGLQRIPLTQHEIGQRSYTKEIQQTAPICRDQATCQVRTHF